MEYFDLLHTLTAPISVQYQSLCEASQKYQPGSQFGAFVRSVSMSPTNIPMKEDAFVFEPFISSRYIYSYIIFVLCIIGCRVWVNICVKIMRNWTIASIFVSESRRGKQVVSRLDHPMISSYRMNLHSWVEMVYFVT